MKKEKIILVFFLTSIYSLTLRAQQNQVVPLNIGDSIPDLLWNLPLKVVNNLSGEGSTSLGNYSDRLIVVDFWATWCSPCIKSIDKLDDLQKEMGSKLHILLATYENRSQVDEFIRGKKWSLPSAVSDTTLKQYFPYRMVPHQVWIYGNKVRAIVSGENATVANLTKILNDEEFTLPLKKDILDFDGTSSITDHVDRIKIPTLSQSTLIKFVDGLPTHMSDRVNNENRIRFVNYINAPPLMMYLRTLAVNTNRILIREKGRDDSELSLSGKWKDIYCYQLILPDTVDKKKVQRRILSDLNFNFNVQVDTQWRDMDCYVISKDETVNGKQDDVTHTALTAAGEQTAYNFSSFVALLNLGRKWTNERPIFVDESGYSGRIISGPPANLKCDIEQLQNILSPYGLIVHKEKRSTEMFVLTDLDE